MNISVWQWLFPDVGVTQLLDTDEPVTGWFLVSNHDGDGHQENAPGLASASAE